MHDTKSASEEAEDDAVDIFVDFAGASGGQPVQNGAMSKKLTSVSLAVMENHLFKGEKVERVRLS